MCRLCGARLTWLAEKAWDSHCANCAMRVTNSWMRDVQKSKEHLEERLLHAMATKGPWLDDGPIVLGDVMTAHETLRFVNTLKELFA